MKRISIIAALAAFMMLVSCAGTSAEETAKSDDTTMDVETSNDTALEETFPLEDDGETVDFATVEVSDYVFMTVGEVAESMAEPGTFVDFVSSKPSVATVDSEGTVTAHLEGVVLVAHRSPGGAFTASAICVFPEGEGPDRSAGESANVFEVGETFMHIAPVGGVEYSSSNENVVDVSNAPNLSFKESGYACVTCASTSRPFFYNFIVYDREVE